MNWRVNERIKPTFRAKDATTVTGVSAAEMIDFLCVCKEKRAASCMEIMKSISVLDTKLPLMV